MTKELKMTKTIVPAAPGFYVVEHISGDDGWSFEYYAVVAWVITTPDDYGYTRGEDATAYAYPICTDYNLNDSSVNHIIRQPDGTIVFPQGPIFEKGQEAEALAYANQPLLRSAAIKEAKR